jgi:hypothetical protein
MSEMLSRQGRYLLQLGIALFLFTSILVAFIGRRQTSD